MNSMNGPRASVTANGQVPYPYEMERFYFEIEILEIEGVIGFGTTCMASVHRIFERSIRRCIRRSIRCSINPSNGYFTVLSTRFKSSLIKLKILPNSLKDTLLKKNGRVT